MRFIPNGPSLPDDLLNARDAGQVVFFCGAGVSMAEAELPDFRTLADRVQASLGSVGAFENVNAIDRIFGMLEDEFETTEVREAVAKELKPKHGYGLGAHRILLDLSRTRGGVPRLVTTNFDRLFEECEPDCPSSTPPRLPDPRREEDFRGIIHLHGCVDDEYRGARDDEFVLSSADFGHAYLSDGWATRYIQSLIQRFRIVFVGYRAEDPPVQYLLEALNRFAKLGHGLYAFQAGDEEQAAAQWAHKGVKPICYDSTNGHAALWQTLSAWAERARDVNGWHDRLLTRASKGPATMAPHERGMIAHLVSSASGARLLATSPTTLPADWLFVLDRCARYEGGGKVVLYDKMSDYFDPFDTFGLDSDTPPLPSDPEDYFAKRVVPEEAWDGFASNVADRMDLPVEATARLKGRADFVPKLPPRLWSLGMWIVKIAHQPATLWWAAKQSPLHPDIQQRIEWSLRHESTHYLPAVRDGWRALFACWQQRIGDPSSDRYAIEEKAEREGWSPSLVRETIALYRPMLTVHPCRDAKPPEPRPSLDSKDIISVDVEYPRPYEPLNIPPDLLGYAVTLFRQQLECAVQLEREVSGHDNLYFDTIRPDDGEALDHDSYGLTGHLVTFTNMVMQLSQADDGAARKEVAQWSGRRDKLFTRLRIWAGGRGFLTTPEEAGQIFLDLDDEAFWGSHERDLLFALRDRWSEIPASMRARLEARLCEGGFPWEEQGGGRDKQIAYCRLKWLHWLSTQGVAFSFDLEAETSKLRSIAPDWTEAATKHTAQPNVSRVFSIKTDTSAAPLDGIPIGEILEKAEVLGKRQFDSYVDRQPFHGLVKDRPARALSVLSDATRKGIFVSWAWSALLSAHSNAELSPRLHSVIGHRIAKLSSDHLAEIVHPVSAWLLEKGEQLFLNSPHVFDLVWDAMIRPLQAAPEMKPFQRPNRRWVDESLNRPAGRLTEAAFTDPAGKTFQTGQGLPIAWIRRFDQLLGLPDDHRLHAIVIMTSRLNWLFNIDPCWTADRLLPLSNNAGYGSKPFWAGYFWTARVPQHPLYQLLKPRFIALVKEPGMCREHADKLAGMLLAGWYVEEDVAEPQQLISDRELREILVHADDNLRTKVLMYLKRWVLETDSRWSERLLPFLIHVWPRQRVARTARVSGRLVDLALAIPEQFPEIVQAILPRLVPIESSSSMLVSFTDASAQIIGAHSRTLLDLLWAILAETPADWPYGASEIIAQLARRTETEADSRLSELLRREQQRL